MRTYCCFLNFLLVIYVSYCIDAHSGLVELLKHALDKHVDIDVFRVYSKTHQALLYPIFSIQDKLKISTLGSMVWDSIAKRHIQIHKGKTLPIKELMVLVSKML